MLLVADFTARGIGNFQSPPGTCSNPSGCYVLSGTITGEDATRVNTVVNDLVGRKLSTPMIWLDSPGGSVDAAILIGRNLRRARAIAAIGEKGNCLSACVFVLAGATQRVVGGIVGIHRPYDAGSAIKTFDETQRDYTRLARDAKVFLAEMNLPEQLYEAMVRIPPEEMRRLEEHELATFGLNKVDPVYEDYRDSQVAKQFGVSKQVYLQRKALSKTKCDMVLQQSGSDISAYTACDDRVMRTGR